MDLCDVELRRAVAMKSGRDLKDVVKATFDNGDVIITDFNASAGREALAKYYFGHWFNLGSDKDDMHRCVKVEFPQDDGTFLA